MVFPICRIEALNEKRIHGPRLSSPLNQTLKLTMNHNLARVLGKAIKLQKIMVLSVFFCFLFCLPINAVLINHVISKYQVASVIDCAHGCVRESSCVSFNYEDHPTSRRHVCQINDEKKQKKFENFIDLDGFSYYEFEVSQNMHAF